MLGNHARTTVVIADDHPLHRDALSQAITAWPDLELLAAATDGRSALEQIRELSPDVAVLDMRMPGLRGIDVVERSRATARPRGSSCFPLPASAVVYAAVAAGAAGYWSKDAERGAIAAVARGEKVLETRRCSLASSPRSMRGRSTATAPS